MTLGCMHPHPRPPCNQGALSAAPSGPPLLSGPSDAAPWVPPYPGAHIQGPPPLHPMQGTSPLHYAPPAAAPHASPLHHAHPSTTAPYPLLHCVNPCYTVCPPPATASNTPCIVPNAQVLQLILASHPQAPPVHCVTQVPLAEGSKAVLHHTACPWDRGRGRKRKVERGGVWSP